MGYTTDFTGAFTVTPALKPEHAAYIRKFNKTRRMKRDAAKAAKMPDPIREAVGLPVGNEGAFFVGGEGYMGQKRDASVLDYNHPPSGQPGLWCQWTTNEAGTTIEWDEGEKFYDYTEWLAYLIENFLSRWGYTVNGEVEWAGEDRDDLGKLVVKDNVVSRGR